MSESGEVGGSVPPAGSSRPAPPPAPASAGPPVVPYPASVRYPEPRTFPTGAPIRGASVPDAPSGVPAGYSQYTRRPTMQPSSSGSPVLAAVALTLALATVIVLIVGLQVHNNRKDKQPSLTAPAGFGPYQRITDAGVARLDAVLSTFLTSANNGKLSQLHAQGSLVVYRDSASTTPRFGSVYMPTNKLGELGDGNANDFANDLLGTSTVTNGKEYAVGVEGGRMRCGVITQSTRTRTVCAWTGSLTTGVLISIAPADRPAALATIVSDFRRAMEL